MNPDHKRRRLLAALAGMVMVAPTLAGKRLLATPAQSAGPFYPPELPLDDDNDLTRVAGRDGVAAGQAQRADRQRAGPQWSTDRGCADRNLAV